MASWWMRGSARRLEDERSRIERERGELVDCREWTGSSLDIAEWRRNVIGVQDK